MNLNKVKRKIDLLLVVKNAVFVCVKVVNHIGRISLAQMSHAIIPIRTVSQGQLTLGNRQSQRLSPFCPAFY